MWTLRRWLVLLLLHSWHTHLQSRRLIPPAVAVCCFPLAVWRLRRHERLPGVSTHRPTPIPPRLHILLVPDVPSVIHSIIQVRLHGHMLPYAPSIHLLPIIDQLVPPHYIVHSITLVLSLQLQTWRRWLLAFNFGMVNIKVIFGRFYNWDVTNNMVVLPVTGSLVVLHSTYFTKF